MAGYDKWTARADRQASQTLRELGRELRLARLDHDLSQATAADAAAVSRATWSRIERGAAPGIDIPDLARALAVVGLELHVRAYPGGAALRDVAHLRLLERLRARLHASARWATEVPLPNPGDRRAWDALVVVAGVRIGVEAETRVRDAQELQRRLSTKRRDGGVDLLVLLLADTRYNRGVLRAAGAGFWSAFPTDGRIALGHLSAGRAPDGDAIILL
jgi:transcriptional regulator with XRE-family HTH domain